ncbi:hypothetical protein PF007_g30161 [Phytophthora fragariae]|uniref:Uncharacterized protein n=2 Tax=Phytophthora fragariae TaxID=53985 RepID=A0A6A3PWL8_9STRA|nr:hypothetical protein PF007_g30161 [Phytophthora fragariae]
MEIAESEGCAPVTETAKAKAETVIQESAEAKESAGKKKKATKEVAEVADVAATKEVTARDMMGPPAKKAAAKSAAIALVSLRAASSAVPSPDAAVGEVVADMVTSVEISEHLTTPDRAPRLAAETVPTTGTAKQRRAPQSSSRKRRRSVLQDDEDDEVRYVAHIQHKVFCCKRCQHKE